MTSLISSADSSLCTLAGHVVSSIDQGFYRYKANKILNDRT